MMNNQNHPTLMPNSKHAFDFPRGSNQSGQQSKGLAKPSIFNERSSSFAGIAQEVHDDIVHQN